MWVIIKLGGRIALTKDLESELTRPPSQNPAKGGVLRFLNYLISKLFNFYLIQPLFLSHPLASRTYKKAIAFL
jgi:hypothetical protein